MRDTLQRAPTTHPSRGRDFLERLLAPAGIEIDGTRPMDLQVHDPRFFDDFVPRGSKGILDAYVDGLWDCDALDELVARMLASGVHIPMAGKLHLVWRGLVARALNRQNTRRSLSVRRHYDLGNDLFRAMLDRRMVYSCAYWRNADDLDQAQEAKLDLVCRKLGLKAGQRVLDIGCGWGSFARFAAEEYGATVLGITLSEPQRELGSRLTAGLPVELRIQDYRELDEDPFDAIVSMGMFEHVGYKNYSTFMRVVRRHLNPDGLFLLHTIGGRSYTRATNPWINDNIFPNAVVPTVSQIALAPGRTLVMEDWHNFGADYDRTLMAWWRNFDAAWDDLRPTYGDRFYRVWRCYLHICAGSFRARDTQLWQIVFSPSGVPGGYVSAR